MRDMLHELIAEHRTKIIGRTHDKVAAHLRSQNGEQDSQVHGVPLFLDQLVARLKLDERSSGDGSDTREIGASAMLHGAELLRSGITIRQVVQGYAHIGQAVAELTAELGVPSAVRDLDTMRLCLDVAVAEAVSEYTRQREENLVGQSVEQLGFLAHEMRNALNTATLAHDALQVGGIAPNSITAGILGRSLVKMRDLVNRSLADVRIEAGSPRKEPLEVAQVLEEIEIASSIQAQARGVRLHIAPAPLGMIVIGGTTEQLFHPYHQRSVDRTGAGLGLTISLKGARAMGGDLRVRDVPGHGCVFTVDLPCAVASPLAA